MDGGGLVFICFLLFQNVYFLYEILPSRICTSPICHCNRVSPQESFGDSKNKIVGRKIYSRQKTCMMRRTKIVVSIFLFFVLVTALSACTKTATNTNTRTAADDITDTVDALTGIGTVEVKLEQDKKLAADRAKELWRARYLEGEDLSQGPCLSNDLIPGWVGDIAHSPRVSADDQPQNQCSAFVTGQAQHFVELDPMGNVIRSQ
jgi:hypothetical protein